MKHTLLMLWLAACITAASAQDAARPQVGQPVIAAHALLKAGQASDALAKLREAEAAGTLTPYEAFIVHRTRATVALAAGELVLAASSVEATLATGRLASPERLELIAGLADAAFRARQPTLAVRWAQRYLDEGGLDERMRTLLIQAQLQSGDCAGATRQLVVALGADEAEGRAPAESRLRVLASCQRKLGDEAAYLNTLEKLARHHPKKDVWAELLSRIEVGERLQLDLFRLMRATGNLDNAESVVAMAQLSLAAGLPTEAKAIVDEGFARGWLATDAHRTLRDRLNRLAAEDLAAMARSDTRDALAMVNTGYALVAAGQADPGLAWMERGLAQRGLKHTDEARLRHGIALSLAGRADAARQAFAQVRGDAAALARLWALFAAARAPAQ